MTNLKHSKNEEHNYMTALPATRPDRSAAMDEFLARIGWQGATRRMLAGDASFRRYERVHWGDQLAVLMDAPPPWEDVRPFMAVTQLLAGCDVTVPTIIAADEAQGFLLLEDLGDISFTRLLRAEPQREAELYLAAMDALIQLRHISDVSAATLVPALPPYNKAVYLREAALFAEWFLPQIHGLEKARTLRSEYLAIWEAILADTQVHQHCLVHRDYHADNLFWLADREGHHAVGMIDYQDALWGDAAYDVASLLEDARRDVSAATVAQCLTHYITATSEDAANFGQRYAVIAAQRNAKIIGIFARLCVRDGKAHYLDYLTRVWGHMMRDLSHPSLAPLHAFIEAHVPRAWRGAFTPDMSLGGVTS
jgi:hypothetical protein